MVTLQSIPDVKNVAKKCQGLHVLEYAFRVLMKLKELHTHLSRGEYWWKKTAPSDVLRVRLTAPKIV